MKWSELNIGNWNIEHEIGIFDLKRKYEKDEHCKFNMFKRLKFKVEKIKKMNS